MIRNSLMSIVCFVVASLAIALCVVARSSLADELEFSD
jgi:hypothetical protein